MLSRLGDYELLRELARGAQGVVYQAKHAPTGREVAIKLLLEGSSNPTALRRLRREAEALARLRHRGVVAIHEVGESPAGPYLVMDLVEGVTLAERLEGRPLEPDDAVWIARALADALAHAHAAGVLHRDIKPSNVLLDRDGAPRLTDFGLARELGADRSQLSLTGHMLGTPGYLPPEQAHGDLAAIGPASDVFALGATLFEMLTGRAPYVGSSLPELLSTMFKPAPLASSVNPEVPRELDAICARCLEAQPERRYADGAALRDALQAYLERPAGSAPPARLRRGLVGLALGGVLLGAWVWAGWGTAPAASEPGVEAPPASAPLPPWPAPPPGWTLGWSLAEGRARCLADALWDEPGRVAAPSAAIAAGRGVADAFLGRATALPGGRVRVVYDGPADFSTSLSNPGDAFEFALAKPGLFLSAEGLELVAPNNCGSVWVEVGQARWRDPEVNLSIRELPEPPGVIDGAQLAVWVGASGAACVSLSFRDRHGTVATTRRGVRGNSVTQPFDIPSDRWVPVRFAPGAAEADRVQVDGMRLPALGGHVEGGREGRVRLEASEHHVLLRDLTVEGTPLVPGRPAWSVALVGTEASEVSITAAFESDRDGQGGPVLGLGTYRCELTDSALVMRCEGRPVAERALAAPLRSGWMRLERREGAVRVRLAGGATELELALGDPLPLREGDLRVAYGSSGRRVRFGRVEAHEGRRDPARRTLSRVASQGPSQFFQALTSLPASPWRDWWEGSTLLASVTRQDWITSVVLGPRVRTQRRAVSRRAGELLERAGGALPPGSVAQADACARALLAWVATGDPDAAVRSAQDLLAAAGEPARAHEVLGVLLPPVWLDDANAVLHQLGEGYVTTAEPLDVREAAAKALLELRPGPALQSQGTYVLARVAYERKDYARALALNARALELAPAADARRRMFPGQILMGLERWDDALEALEPLEFNDWWLWSLRATALEKLGRDSEALVALLGMFGGRPTPSVGEAVLQLASRIAPRHPGLAALAVCVVEGRAPVSDSRRDEASSWIGQGFVGDPREGCLAWLAQRYREVRPELDPPLASLAADDPLRVVCRAKAGDVEARAQLAEAMRRSWLVRILSMNDPELMDSVR